MDKYQALHKALIEYLDERKEQEDWQAIYSLRVTIDDIIEDYIIDNEPEPKEQ